MRKFQVPFQDDLTEVDDDLFNLDGFKHYKESPEVRAYRERLGLAEGELGTPVKREKEKIPHFTTPASVGSFMETCKLAQPVVFVSKLSNPYLNLALEDYIYTQMPLPASGNANRLMFYVNTPCVVIGKNQNPWNEVNLPLLNSLRIPLVRRRSGGGTVVHDTGNVNYSFMTSKAKFDRHVFANLVTRAVNGIEGLELRIRVTERGDIVTEGQNLKVSGSAYKLSKGKSYHHGTMLLSLNLDVLRQLLHRDEGKVGRVESHAAIASVRSPVTNLGIENSQFVDAVTAQFKDEYGLSEEKPAKLSEPEEFDQTELLGLDGFVDAYSARNCAVFEIDDTTELPEEVAKVRSELAHWDWRFGATSKFNHTFTKDGFQVEFSVGKGALVKEFTLVGAGPEIQDAFEFLDLVVKRGDSVKYTGSDVAGFITDDAVSDWLGESIDGST